jgi:hypothetical protein
MNVEASGRPSRFSVVVSGCFSPSVAASVDCSHAPAQPIELRLPPTGEVELAYEEADGTPISIQGGAAIVPRWDASSIGPEPKPLPLWEWRDAGTDVVRAPAQSSVVFSRVGLGSHLTAWTQRNSLSAAARREFEGPSKEGERVRVVLHPPEVAQIRGQFVDEQLKPRPGVEISARALELPPSGGWNYMNAPGDWVQEKQLGSRLLSESPDLMRADAQGRFRLDLDRSEFESEDVRLAFIEDQGQPSERRAIAQLDDPRPAGPIDLGPLKLSPAPVIAAGVVHDEAGLPLGGVEVCVLDNGGGLRGARFQTTSAPNGSFKLIATCLDKRVELRLTGLDLVDKTLREMEVGNSSAQIVMQRAGRIRGRVVVPAGIEPRSVSVGWTPEAKELRDSLGYGMTQPDADARFEISGLAPGTYSIRVSWKGTRSNPGLSRKEVRVDAGMITDLGEIQSAAEGK